MFQTYRQSAAFWAGSVTLLAVAAALMVTLSLFMGLFGSIMLQIGAFFFALRAFLTGEPALRLRTFTSHLPDVAFGASRSAKGLRQTLRLLPALAAGPMRCAFAIALFVVPLVLPLSAGPLILCDFYALPTAASSRRK